MVAELWESSGTMALKRPCYSLYTIRLTTRPPQHVTNCLSLPFQRGYLISCLLVFTYRNEMNPMHVLFCVWMTRDLVIPPFQARHKSSLEMRPPVNKAFFKVYISFFPRPSNYYVLCFHSCPKKLPCLLTAMLLIGLDSVDIDVIYTDSLSLF